MTLFITIGLLMLVTVMLPGPDTILVIRNTLFYSRRMGIYTTLGIASAMFVHIAYCTVGFAVLISKSVLLFKLIKYTGVIYLIYLGVSTLFSHPFPVVDPEDQAVNKTLATNFGAFQQGFICNLLNPNATLFFLSLFTSIIPFGTPVLQVLALMTEIFAIVILWFSGLSICLSHFDIFKFLNKNAIFIKIIFSVTLISVGMMKLFT